MDRFVIRKSISKPAPAAAPTSRSGPPPSPPPSTPPPSTPPPSTPDKYPNGCGYYGCGTRSAAPPPLPQAPSPSPPPPTTPPTVLEESSRDFGIRSTGSPIFSSDDEEETSQKDSKKVNNRQQKFRRAWLDTFPWCSVVDEKPFCRHCNKKLTNNVINLKRHDRSDQHIEIVKSLKKQILIEKEKLKEASTKKNNIKKAELLIIMFLVEHNLPLLLILPLINLIKAVSFDSAIAKQLKCGKTKATDTITKLFANDHLQEISSTLKKQTFSIIVDESTDISTKKSLAIVVRYFDYLNAKVKDRFLSLLELSTSSAKDIYDAITTLLTKMDVPIKNLIGYAADNASVMMGNKSGLKALFLKDVPNLYVMPCTCHSIYLCSSSAGKEMPNSIEKLVRNIYMYFSHSAKRQADFKKFQEHFHVKNHKILKLSFTRWLSLEGVVNRVLEQWVPLKHFFLLAGFEADSDLAENINSELNTTNKIYLTYLSYILKLTNEVNTEFQAEKPQIHTLMSTVKSFFKNVLSNFIQRQYLTDAYDIDFNNEQHHIRTEDIYIGPKAELLIKTENMSSAQIFEIKSICLNYYTTLCRAVKKRFDFNDKTLSEMQKLDPSNLGESLVELIALFPNLAENISIDDLELEWRALLNFTDQSRDREYDLERFWSDVFSAKNGLKQERFPNIKKFVGSLLALPHSSATCERVFSSVNLIKTKTRNCLNVSTVSGILSAKSLLDDFQTHEWIPSANLMKQYNSSYL